MMNNMVKHKPGIPSWVTYIQRRIKGNLNFMAIFNGETGVGKSWSALSVAHQIDPNFEVKQVAFSFKEVMNIINAEWFKKKEWKIIIFDEPQTSVSSREWQSKSNKLFNYLLSTFRHQNVILFFCTPYEDFIDGSTRKLIHSIFEVKSHDRKTNKTTIRPKLLQYNSRLKKFYYHSLYVIKNKRANKLSSWKVDKPPEHLIEPYEEVKTAFTTKLNEEILKDLSDMDNSKKPKLKPLTDKQLVVYNLHNEGLNSVQIAEKLKVTQPNISQQLGFIRKKGYPLRNENIIENNSI